MVHLCRLGDRLRLETPLAKRLSGQLMKTDATPAGGLVEPPILRGFFGAKVWLGHASP